MLLTWRNSLLTLALSVTQTRADDCSGINSAESCATACDNKCGSSGCTGTYVKTWVSVHCDCSSCPYGSCNGNYCDAADTTAIIIIVVAIVCGCGGAVAYWYYKRQQHQTQYAPLAG
mmetsp:Transcript_12026/g.30944  ORF Transcript_12026/g.30944 Transcript_12026/m.30944 type:complete len:117 (-) Transcript_12026:338-688(-)